MRQDGLRTLARSELRRTNDLFSMLGKQHLYLQLQPARRDRIFITQAPTCRQRNVNILLCLSMSIMRVSFSRMT